MFYSLVLLNVYKNKKKAFIIFLIYLIYTFWNPYCFDSTEMMVITLLMNYNRVSGEKDYEDTKNYIKDCLKDSINIDKSFKHVYENLYVGNYIGFNDYSSMNKFMNINLHYLYLNSFPNLASEFFCTFCSFILFALILCSIKRCCHKDKPNEGFNR